MYEKGKKFPEKMVAKQPELVTLKYRGAKDVLRHKTDIYIFTLNGKGYKICPGDVIEKLTKQEAKILLRNKNQKFEEVQKQ